MPYRSRLLKLYASHFSASAQIKRLLRLRYREGSSRLGLSSIFKRVPRSPRFSSLKGHRPITLELGAFFAGLFPVGLQSEPCRYAVCIADPLLRSVAILLLEHATRKMLSLDSLQLFDHD